MAFNSTPRRRFGVALGVVLTGVAAGLIGFAGVASAHIPDIKAECKDEKTTLSVKLTHYVPNSKKPNKVKITDGDKVLDEVDFRDKYEKRFVEAGDVDHTFKIVVTAWDDPKFEKGWSFKTERKVKACVTPTTTTTTESTTSSTTTTTESTTTTTESTTESTTTTTDATTTTTDSVSSTTTTPPAPTTTTPPVVEEDDLAETGASIGVPLGIGAVLLVGGVVLLFVIRRRGKA